MKKTYKHAYKCMKKTRIQMYEKNTHMKKTRIQTRIQMQENKQAYICIIKTYTQMYEKKCIQMYEKNMHANTHTNVLKKHAYKSMNKTHTNV